MKKFSAIIGIIAITLIVFFTVRYGVVNAARADKELYQWRLNWMDRK